MAYHHGEDSVRGVACHHEEGHRGVAYHHVKDIVREVACHHEEGHRGVANHHEEDIVREVAHRRGKDQSLIFVEGVLQPFRWTRPHWVALACADLVQRPQVHLVAPDQTPRRVGDSERP